MRTLLLNRRYLIALIVSVFFVLMGSGQSQQASSGTSKAATAKHRKHSSAPDAGTHTLITPDQMQWSAGPASLPAGAQLVVLNGNPMKPGPFTIRLKMPDGYKIPPHWHPTAENVTVISGEFHVGTGGTVDESKATSLPAGSYARREAHDIHYGWAAGETIIQINGMGPFAIHYVKPSDDPRTKS